MKNLLFLFLIATSIFLANKAEAVSTDTPFGGKSSSILLCSCSGSFMITITNLVHNSAKENFIYSPFTTTLYPYFLFLLPDVWMVGTAETLSAECMEVSPSGCTSVGSGYPIKMLGTSI